MLELVEVAFEVVEVETVLGVGRGLRDLTVPGFGRGRVETAGDEGGIPKIYSRELTELIFVNPYCRIGDVVKADIAKRQTAAVYLKALAAEGLLEEIKAGRENLYINPPLLTLLSDRA